MLTQMKYSFKKTYAKYSAYIDPLLKLLLAVFIFTVINAKLGYMDRLNSFAIVLLVALFCSFMPLNVMAAIAALFILLHLYALSIECAMVAGVILLMLFLLYIRIVPKEAIVVLLTPVLFMMKIPYVMPVALGLVGTPVSAVSVSCGVIAAYVIQFMSENGDKIAAIEDGNMVLRLRTIIDGILADKTMFVVIIAFSFTVITVYFIRRLSIEQSWKMATVAGVIVDAIILLVCKAGIDANLSAIGIIVGSVFALVVGVVLDLLLFNVDYRKVENLQFEDDEYYYYVKAVPKIGAVSDKRSKNTTRRSSQQVSERTAEQRTVRTANGVRRTGR